MKENIKQQIKQHWQEQSAKLKEWWSRLSLKEKQAVSIGGSILGVLFFYLIIWSPFLSHLDVMRKRIQTDGKTLVWMKAADAKIKEIEGKEQDQSRIATPVVLMGILQKQVNQNALGQFMTQLKQASNDTVEMNFKQVEFDKLISFLTAVIKKHSVTVEQLSATAGGASGIVDAEIVLKL